MSSPNKLRVGIIGLGHWGPHIVRNFSTDRRCSVRYVCDLLDSTFQRVENLIQADCSKTTRAEELIQSSEVDAVVIATSASTHYQLVKQALQARKHVFCEKPPKTAISGMLETSFVSIWHPFMLKMSSIHA